MTIKELALHYLYGQLRAAKIALGHAERREGVTQEELNNLEKKIAAIDWLIPLAIKEDE